MNAPIPAWVGGALESVPEIDVHRRGLRHRAVAVFVTQGTRVLIRQRPRAAYLVPGLWSTACHAHPAWDETPEICAARLLRDSAPPQTDAPRWRGSTEYRAVLAGSFVDHERVEMFSARAGPLDRGDRPAGNICETPRESLAGRLLSDRTDAIWIDVEDLLAEARRRAERFTPWLHVALTEHLPLVLD